MSLMMWRKLLHVSAVGGAPPWTPADLGATLLTWLEADPDYLYQTTTGTAVTADTNPVGFVRDKKGTVGAELITNGTFDDATGWTLGTGWSVTGGKLVGATGANSGASFGPVGVADRYYLVTFDAVVNAGGFTAQIGFSGNVTLTSFIGATGSYEFILRCGASGFNFSINKNTSFSGNVDNVSVREITGIHATQATSSARPLYRTGAGLPYLQFDGTDDGLGLTLAATSARNFYFLMRTADTTGLLALFNTSIFAGAWQATGVAPHSGFGSPLPTYFVDNVEATSRIGISNELTDDQWSIVEIRGLVNPSWTSTNLFNYGSSFTVDGDLAAYLATDAATETAQDRDNIRAYLQGLIP